MVAKLSERAKEAGKICPCDHRISGHVKPDSIYVENVRARSVVGVPCHEHVARVEIRMVRTGATQRLKQRAGRLKARIAVIAWSNLAEHGCEVMAFGNLAGGDIASSKDRSRTIADHGNDLRSRHSGETQPE
jgi:hypothetical protein